MLVEHRVDDVNEGLVRVKETVAAGEQVPLEPALALVLAQDLHHAACWRKKLVPGHDFSRPLPVGGLEDGVQAIGERFVGSKQAKRSRRLVEFDHIPQEPSEHARVLGVDRTRCGHLHRVVAKVGHAQLLEKQPAIRVWIRSHPPRALGRELREFGPQPPARIK